MMSRTSQATANAYTQDLEEIQVTLGGDKESLKNIFRKIEHQTQFRFSFFEDHINAYSAITFPNERRSVKATLDLAFEGLPLTYVQKGKMVYIRKKDLPSSTGASAAPPYFISGKVTTAQTNEPMAGVNILVKGTTNGTTTDAEGAYVIEASENDILVFSFIGHKTVEESVGKRTSISVSMVEEIEALDEVVVNAGYYLTTDKKKTGSIVKVTSKEIEDQPVTSPLMSLQGRMAGVDISPRNGLPGSSVKVQIRGQNSVRTNRGRDVDGNLPLYIVDGIPLDSRPLLAAASSLVGVGFDPLSTINPANIESIEVLKDADATAIYGSRGANGVVLITTKNASKTGTTNVEVNYYRGWGKIANTMDLLNTKQYLEMRREAFKNDQAAPGGLFFPDYDLLRWDSTRYTDWQDVLIGNTAEIEDMQFKLSGGNTNTSFLLGGGMHNESLVFPGDFGYKRITGSVHINHVSDNQKLRASVSANYGTDNNKLFDDVSVMTNTLTMPPNAPALYDEKGVLNWENSTWINPMVMFKNVHRGVTDNLITNVSVEYALLKELSAKVNLGYTDLNGSEEIRYPISAYNPAEQAFRRGSVANGINKRKSWIVEPQMTYRLNFSRHHADFLLGGTWQNNRYKSQLLSAGGYTSDAFLGNMQAATAISFVRDDRSQYKYAAVFGRIGYNWDSRYFINLTARRDGSSRFGPNNKFANFGAIGAAWVFTNEKFGEELNRFLSFGKIRGSYGITGSDQIGDYRFYDTYRVTYQKYDDAIGLYPTGLFNPNYAWESTRKLETAIELGFFDDRIFLESGAYWNRSFDQLVEYPLPYVSGFESVLINSKAIVGNNGLEISLRTENLHKGKVRWNSAFNISFPRNKLIKFPNLKESPYASQYEVGKPLSIMKLYTLTGVNQETGYYEALDVDNNGAFDMADRTFIQDIGRKYYGGISNTLTFGSLEVDFLFQFVRQTSLAYNSSWPGLQGNQPVNVMNRWRKEGDIVDVQKFSQDVFGPTQAKYSLYESSNALVENSSFIRLKTLSISYNLPISGLSKVGFQTLRVYIQGQNLLTFSGYDGLDPETGSSLPPLRMITVGVQAKI